MEVSISSQMTELIQDKVANGAYASPSEMVNEALRLLNERDDFIEHRLERLRQEVAVGVAQSDRGESLPLDIETIKAEGRRAMADRSGARDIPAVFAS